MEKLLLISVFVACLVVECLSIQCHQCAMVGGDDCGDPYTDDNVDDCGDKDTHCLKLKTTVKIGDSGYINGVQKESVIITRGCERAPGYGDGCSYTQADGGVIIKCRCSTDSCNSANSIYSTTTLTATVFISIFAAAIFRR